MVRTQEFRLAIFERDTECMDPPSGAMTRLSGPGERAVVVGSKGRGRSASVCASQHLYQLLTIGLRRFSCLGPESQLALGSAVQLRDPDTARMAY